MSRTLPDAATLRDILWNLVDADAFVSQVFGVAHRATKDHGEVQIRLGVTGTGRLPNYRVEHANTGEPIFAVDGANHQRWPNGESFSGLANWSTAVMTKAQVEALLGEIRDFQRPG